MMPTWLTVLGWVVEMYRLAYYPCEVCCNTRNVDEPPSNNSILPFLNMEIRCDNPLEENKRVPPLRPYLSHGSIADLISSLVQACRVLAPSSSLRCADGRGRWTTCVFCTQHFSIDSLRGACACCCYGGRGNICSFGADFAACTIAVAQASRRFAK